MAKSRSGAPRKGLGAKTPRAASRRAAVPAGGAVRTLEAKGIAPRGGRSAETTALAEVLEHAGVVAPHSGEPFSEAMLFGIGGGIGGAYVLYEICGHAFLFLGFRASAGSTKADFLASVCRRLGARTTIREAGGDRAALDHLKDGLARGRPVFVWVGLAGMPYLGFPIEWLKGLPHVALVTGFDEASGIVHVVDRTPHPLAVTAKELAVARAAIVSHRRRSVVVDPPTSPIRLERAVLDGIRTGMRAFLAPPNDAAGVSAFSRWSRLLVDPKEKKGWPRALPGGRRLASALLSTYSSIETGGLRGVGGGGACRGMYADFLEEAGSALGRPALALLAPRYRELAALWTGVAEAALPAHAPIFAEARAIVRRRTALFEEKGQAGQAELLAMMRRLFAIEASCEKAFPLDASAIDALRHDLSARLAAIHEFERAAAEDVLAATDA